MDFNKEGFAASGKIKEEPTYMVSKMATCSGHRYCQNCEKVLETRVFLEGYSQTKFKGISAKECHAICILDSKGQTDAQKGCLSKRSGRIRL